MSALLNISPGQIMHIWENLMDCLHGRNGYGGDTAEIYLYTVMQHSPIVAHDQMEGRVSDRCREVYLEAARTLHGLCRIFEDRQKVRIELEDGELDDLLGPQIFDHRVRLTVVSKERK